MWPTSNHNTIIKCLAGMKRKRCGKCDGCRASDCEKCKFCLDKPRFGGNGILKQCCLKKKCKHLISAFTPYDASGPTITPSMDARATTTDTTLISSSQASNSSSGIIIVLLK